VISPDFLLKNLVLLTENAVIPATTITTMLAEALTETFNIDTDNLRRICESPQLAETRYLRHIGSFQHATIWNGATPLAHSFIAWQENKVQLENSISPEKNYCAIYIGRYGIRTRKTEKIYAFCLTVSERLRKNPQHQRFSCKPYLRQSEMA
jgi:hypothetical protein